ncbi:hypothetical protein ABFG93_07930 [Pseudalkalibacillus hwajinpoensis]|uniref:hypothetical protein n=1 Tax=Guptibacillus hwajinpoensis TaxID=208199 RepID=UPI00325A756F
MKSVKLKKTIYKLVPVLILFSAFLVYLNWSQESEPTFEINENFEEVQSEDKAIKEIIRGLTGSNLATEYDLFTDVDHETFLLEERRTLKVEKVWFQYNVLHLIYSVDLLQKDKRNLDIPYLQFDKVSLHSENKEISLKLDQSLGMGPNWLAQGYVSGHRMYRGVAIDIAGSEQNFEELQHVYEWDDIDHITIETPKIIHVSNEESVIDSFSINASLDPAYDQPLKTFKLNESTKLLENSELVWRELMLTIDHANLSFQLKNTDKILQGVTLATRADGGVMMEQYYPVTRKEDYYEVNLNSFEKTPTSFQVEVRAVEFTDRDEPLTYTISNEILTKGMELPDGEKVEISEEIGNKNGMTISFGGFSNALPGYEMSGVSEVLGLELQIESIPDEQFHTWFKTVTEEMQNLKYSNVGSSSLQTVNYGPLIEISNEKGKLAETYGSSSEGFPDKEIQVFHINRDFLERSSEVTLKLSHFPIYEKTAGEINSFELQ